MLFYINFKTLDKNQIDFLAKRLQYFYKKKNYMIHKFYRNFITLQVICKIIRLSIKTVTIHISMTNELKNVSFDYNFYLQRFLVNFVMIFLILSIWFDKI